MTSTQSPETCKPSGTCSICGAESVFEIQPNQSLREARCPACQASKRTRDLASCLLAECLGGDGRCLDAALEDLSGLRIYEAQADGVLHQRLRNLPGYACSEFLDGVAPGEVDANGVRCEDLTALSFPDASFDVVITQDVFEHIPEPMAAFAEIARVLRPGGRHIFTVPLHEGRATVRRVLPGPEGATFPLPKVWHGDPLRADGSLVHTDFGDDLPELLEPLGLATRVGLAERFYTPAQIPFVGDEAEWRRCEDFRLREAKLEYFHYNSVVFVSRKPGEADHALGFTSVTDPFQVLRRADLLRLETLDWDIASLRGETVWLDGVITLCIDVSLSHAGAPAGVVMLVCLKPGGTPEYRFPRMLGQAGGLAWRLAQAMHALLLRAFPDGRVPARFCVDGQGAEMASGGTSERVVPGWSPLGTVTQHLRRYQFAAGLAQGRKRALDLGCGLGYGLGLLPCPEGTGMDLSAEALEWARSVYAAGGRDFVRASIADENSAQALTGAYDMVTCFEALEHLPDHSGLLDLAASRLAEDGIFVVSVPCPELHGSALNPYHLRDFTPEHFRFILEQRFAQVEFFHQERDGSGDLTTRSGVKPGLEPGAEFWLAVCSKPKAARKRFAASIVMPLFNKFGYTLKALQAIAKNTPDDEPFEVILVDNASSDETPRALRGVSGDVVVHRNEQNLGFAKASNQGALLARGEYVVFLNNDTEVHPGWLKALLDELRSNPGTGVVGGRLLYPDGTIQHAGVSIGRDLIPMHIHCRKAADDPLVTERRSFPIVTAACAAVRREEFYRLGMFDEAFINGHEDIDLCLRYREKGAEVIYRPDCVVTHHESVSEGRMAMRPHNLARTMKKWRYKLIQDDFRYAYPESQRKTAEKPLRFAVKIGPPDRSARNWGDVFFAECLAKSLTRQGHGCRIDYLNEWGRDDLDIDVVIHLKGLSEYQPKPYNLNILWMLNHPSLHTVEEMNRYDAVLVASGPHAKTLQKTLSVPVLPFLQATDPEHFAPRPDLPKKYDLVFVGNNKGVGRLSMRRIIADLLPTRHSLAVWGDGWDGLLPKGVLRGKFVPFEKLPEVYAQGRIVLNDHQPEMRQYGFINNRTFDAMASGSFVLSDTVRGMDTEFPAPFYNTRVDLARTVKMLLKGGGKLEKQREKLRERVLAGFSFDRRARQLEELAARLLCGEAAGRMARARAAAFDYRREDGPLVSVLMSTHNRRDLLPAAIASVTAQTYPNWELMLVRDGGDPVDDIVAEFGDPRIRLLDREQGKGKGHAVNLAFAESRGQYIAFLDDDDVFYPEHLDTLLFFLHNVPGQRMAVSNTEKVKLKQEEDGGFSEVSRELIYHRQIGLGDLLDKNQITWLSVLCRRDLFEEVGGLDVKLRAFLDHDLWRRMAARAYPYHVTAMTAEYYLREYAAEDGRGQITQMSVADPPRYLANRMRVLGKRLVAEESPLYPVWERLRREARHEFLIARARRFKENGEMERSRRSFALAARLKYNLMATWREMGLTELEAGNPAAALECFQQCLDSTDGRRETDFLHAALAHLELGQPSSVLDCLARLESSYPVNAKVREIIVDYRARAMNLLSEREEGPLDFLREAG